MKLVVQRVKNAKVEVDNQVVGSIEKGFLVLLGVTHNDTREIADYLVKKLVNLRVFEDENGNRTMKGNVDAELVLHAAAVEYNNYNQAIIVTSDGDFACLMRYLSDNDKLKKIITPTERFSKLLKPFVDNILPLKNVFQILFFYNVII